MQRTERVLLVASARAIASHAAKRVVAAGGEAIIVTSLAEARHIGGAFDRGIFSFDLPDGSGIVLAAELMIESRIGEIEFVHPADELVAADDLRPGVRSTADTTDSEWIGRSVA
jgi:hypothetical protein